MNTFEFIEYAAQNVEDAYKSMQETSDKVFNNPIEDWANKYENKPLHADSHLTKKSVINMICKTVGRLRRN